MHNGSLQKAYLVFCHREPSLYFPTNTNTFRMYTAHNMVTDADLSQNHWHRLWILSLISLFILFTQVYICCSMIQDTGFPRCSHHSDCRDGEYRGISQASWSRSFATPLPRSFRRLLLPSSLPILRQYVYIKMFFSVPWPRQP